MQLFDEIHKLNLKTHPIFRVGDAVKVNVRILEAGKSRIQAFEGVCIAKSNKGINSNFTVRKISSGVGVERVFPVHCPDVDSIEVLSQGKVRRAKLYYLRDLAGKGARIKRSNKNRTQLEMVTGSSGQNSKETTDQNSNETKN